MNSFKMVNLNIYQPSEEIKSNYYNPIKDRIKRTNSIIKEIFTNLYDIDEDINHIIREGYIRGYIKYSNVTRDYSKCILESIFETIEQDHLIDEKYDLDTYYNIMNDSINDTYSLISDRYNSLYRDMFNMDEIIDNSRSIACDLLLKTKAPLEDAILESVNIALCKDVYDRYNLRINDPELLIKYDKEFSFIKAKEDNSKVKVKKEDKIINRSEEK